MEGQYEKRDMDTAHNLIAEMDALELISRGDIGEAHGIPTVSGRKLKKVLGVHQDDTSWVKTQADRGQLIENKDFTVFTEFSENPQGGRPAQDYFFTFDAAKEIAMLSRGSKGKLVRKYFIEVEKRWKQQTPAGMDQMIELVGRSIATYVPSMITSQMAPVIAEIKAEQVNLRKDVEEAIRQKDDEILSLREANAVLDQEIKDIFAPPDYLTAYIFVHDYVHGPDREKYAKLLFRSYIDQRRNWDMFHMYAHQQMHARRLQPRKYYDRGYGEAFYYPLEVLQCAFEDFKAFIDTSPQVLRFNRKG